MDEKDAVGSRGDGTDEIRDRVEAATPGPWFWWYGDVITSDDDPRDFYEEEPRHVRVVRAAEHRDVTDSQAVSDAMFIAHSREDVPWLLSEVESLRARVEAAETDRDSFKRQAEHFADRGNRAEAERDATLAVIDEAQQSARENAHDGEMFFSYDVTERILSKPPKVALAARDARIRRQTLEDAADAFAAGEGSDGMPVGRAAVTWLRARAAEEGEKQ